ncbi:PH domain-containing protein [Aquibacillus rhizosphaerae]|uniref:PH domain-containing protein n=1 Tax=Aquibacillus rhizosphaerae TaxID=3051431 RepID=A0ABT7L4V6_9BACI|nr:PH domain-containing protein [Aquibacillus sp. LR5S19]MDL4840902.1 PH domain-containing protein [Aquibacillus sp. LR5S19]
MSSPKRLHPVAIIFTVIKSLRQLIYALFPIIILASSDFGLHYVVLIISIIVVIFIGFSVLSWLRFTYRIEGDQLRIEKGVIVRQKRTISKNRIQSIDLTQGIIHRIFGLTKVQIETAGSDRSVDAGLSAVKLEEGQHLHNELKSKYENVESVVESDKQTNHAQHTITVKRLLLAGSTSASFGIVLSLFALTFTEIEAFVPESFYNRTTNLLLSQGIELLIVLGIVLFILLWMLGILTMVVKYGKFTITRYENELFITRGLLEKKQMTIPIKRIQAVSIKESLIRQPLGFATISVEIAGGETEKQNASETLLFPLLRKTEVKGFLDEILPEYENNSTFRKLVPKRALPYYLLRTSMIPLIGLIGIAIFMPEWVILPIILLGLSVILGFVRYRTTSFNLSENQLTLQLRMFSKEIVLLKSKRIQALERSQHFLHRKQNLGTMKLSILNNFGGRHYNINELNEEDLDKIGDWYSTET